MLPFLLVSSFRFILHYNEPGRKRVIFASFLSNIGLVQHFASVSSSLLLLLLVLFHQMNGLLHGLWALWRASCLSTIALTRRSLCKGTMLGAHSRSQPYGERFRKCNHPATRGGIINITRIRTLDLEALDAGTCHIPPPGAQWPTELGVIFFFSFLPSICFKRHIHRLRLYKL